MAHHRSAKKRIRQTEKRTAVNRSRMSRIKTFVRKVEDALAKGDDETARTAFARSRAGAASWRDQGRPASEHGVAQDFSRLSRRVKALAPAAAAV